MINAAMTIPVWACSTWHSPADLRKMDPARLISALDYRLKPLGDDYVCVGEATVTVYLLPVDKMNENAVGALRAARTKVLAEAQAEATRIEEKINQLLAITHEPTELRNVDLVSE